MTHRTRSVSRRGNCDAFKIKTEDEMKEFKKKKLVELDDAVKKERKRIQLQVNSSIMRMDAMTTNLLSKLPKNVEDRKINDITKTKVNDVHILQTSFDRLHYVVVKNTESLCPERVALTGNLNVKAKSEVKDPKNPRLKKWASATDVFMSDSSKTGVKCREENSTVPIMKTTKFKNSKVKNKLENRRLTRTLSQQMAAKNFHTLYDISKKNRAFSDISTSTGQVPNLTKSMTSLTISRKPIPGERVYLVSGTGSPLSNIEAHSMPTLLLPLQDGSNIAISRANEFNSLGHDAKMHLRFARQEFASLFREISVRK